MILFPFIVPSYNTFFSHQRLGLCFTSTTFPPGQQQQAAHSAAESSLSDIKVMTDDFCFRE